jgi:hypothetical protein
VYVLNSQCHEVACGEGSEQLAWLLEDLLANPRDCVAAAWHEPRFGSGPHGNGDHTGPFWDALYAAGAELVMGGNDHGYERLLPLDPDGRADPEHGMVQFVVGTGGAGDIEFPSPHPASSVREEVSDGILELTLREDGYDWRFVAVPGEPFEDRGSADCHDPPPGAPPGAG